MREPVSDILKRLNFNPTEKQVELFNKLEENKSIIKTVESNDYNFQFNANMRINELQNQVLNDLQGGLEKEDEIQAGKEGKVVPMGMLLSGFKAVTDGMNLIDGAKD